MVSNDVCPICGGAGWLARPANHPDWGKAIPCKCKIEETERAAREAAARVIQYSDLRGSLVNWTLDEFPGDTQAKAVALEAVAKAHGLYVFWSSVGTGKTGLLVGVVNAFLKQNVPALYISMPMLLEKLRHGYGTGEYDEMLNAVISVPVLALDEFDRVKDRLRGHDDGTAQSWAGEKIFLILDERYTHWNTRLTLIATNRAPDKADSDPITSRFGDSLRSRVVHVQGEDLRPEAATYERSGS